MASIINEGNEFGKKYSIVAPLKKNSSHRVDKTNTESVPKS